MGSIQEIECHSLGDEITDCVCGGGVARGEADLTLRQLCVSQRHRAATSVLLYSLIECAAPDSDVRHSPGHVLRR